MATRFYLHAAASGISGTLPSAEQSSLTVTSGCNFEGSQTTNRSMDTSIGTSGTSLARTGTMATSARNYYISRWVSPLIYQTSIAANTWQYAFAHRETAAGCNFPVSGNNAAIRINCYVWRPSTGAAVGTILDGNTASTIDEGSAATDIWHIVNFSGSAVNGLTSGDAVIIFEAWCVTTSTITTSQTLTYYYDGTDDTRAENATGASDAASYINTPETLSLTAPQNIEKALTTETLSITEGIDRARGIPRSITTETLAISEPNAPVIQSAKQRTQTTETLSIVEGLTPLSAKQRSQTTETLQISETSDILREKQRPLDTETLDITESVSQEASSAGPRNIEKGLPTESLTISDSYSRMTAKWRRIG